MDLATVIGLALGAVSIVVSILLGGSLMAFVDLPSVFVVFGGGLASAVISVKLDQFLKIGKIAMLTFTGKPVSFEATIRIMVELTQKARKDGLLALEADTQNISDDFLKQALMQIVDGVEPDVIRETMELELSNMEARHQKGIGLFKTLGSLFPAWGMIGTLIGLVNLLKSLSDPSAIGPAMAVALITTFYGSVLANFICIPIANKLTMRSKEEIVAKEMMIEGVLSIQAGENPKIMEYKMLTFLSPEQKTAFKAQTEKAG